MSCFIVPQYEYIISRSIGINLYSALTCYLYQCEENDVIYSELYKLVNTLTANVAHDIISDLPGFTWARL